MPGNEPITAGLNLGSEIVGLITKSLPSDEQQLAIFKEKYPKRYARRMERFYQTAKMHLRWNKRVSIDDWIEYKHGDSLAVSTKELLKKLLHQDLGR